MKHVFPAVYAASILVLSHVGAQAQVPAAIAAPDEKFVAVIQAVGAQIYECKSDAVANHAWHFRGPIASLMIDGRTVGRHFEGPSWEMNDGSVVTAKAVASAPGPNDRDIPLLKLHVTAYRGTGQLSAVTTIQRLNTSGGALNGPCSFPGTYVSVPYSAEYRFLQKAD